MAVADGPRLRMGAFIAPFHDPSRCPVSAAIERDIALARHLEALGYDEVWYGEHHSGGWETIASPELVIAAAAQRTSRIRLGTGVLALPYHHPFTTAQRVALLDHITGGRLLMGVGPGVLYDDALMLGLDPENWTQPFLEALDVVLELFRSAEPVSRTAERFSLHDARLNIRPVTEPHPPLYVTSSFSMRGLELAARLDAGVLQLGVAEGLGQKMQDAEARMAANGLTLDRSRLLLVLPMYAARTAAAMDDIRDAAAREQQAYWLDTLDLPDPGYDAREHVDRMAGSGNLIVGAPEDCIRALQAKLNEVGPMGGLLVADHDWAPWEGRLD